jgi:hypothetical protein
MTIPLVKMKFGSNLYGTTHPLSDLDIKLVFVPDVREILTQQTRDHYRQLPKKASTAKNQPGDVELEAFALHRYLSLVLEGQTTALDMLFAPEWAFLEPPHPAWHAIQHNRSRLITRRTNKFISYAYTQAKKYGIKGSRVGDVQQILAWLDDQNKDGENDNTRLGEFEESLRAIIRDRELKHTRIQAILQKSSGTYLNHLDCCGLKAPFLLKMSEVRLIYQRLMDRYGQRALMAATNQNVDWGAISHAVRIGHQAVQLLRTGIIEFPRPERAYLLEIKQGKHPYATVAAEIEALLVQIVEEQKVSHLPDEPDRNYVDELICDIYGSEVRNAL